MILSRDFSHFFLVYIIVLLHSLFSSSAASVLINISYQCCHCTYLSYCKFTGTTYVDPVGRTYLMYLKVN